MSKEEELRFRAQIVKEQKAEIKRLRALVDKLPKTADGIYVTSPFQTLWRWSNHKPPRLCQVTLYNLGWQKGKDCYSTREAAEASANRNT